MIRQAIDDFVIIGIGPCAFAGASKSHAGTLSLLAESGAETFFISYGHVFQKEALERSGVQIVIPYLRSDVNPKSESIQTIAIINEIIKRALVAHRAGKKVALLGTYLFPFCQVVEHAARLLGNEGAPVLSIITPSGADIWQIGKASPLITRELLTSRSLNTKVCYSENFACEISQWIGDCGDFEIIPPVINLELFSPIAREEKHELRKKMGIPQGNVVLLNCSNMRPIKGLPQLLLAAKRFSKHQPVTLFLVGPVTEHLRASLKQYGVKLGQGIPVIVQHGSLNIRIMGLQRDSVLFHLVSDIAINTSFHDSFNISIAESLSCGTPVLSSSVVGCKEVIQDSSCLRLFAYDKIPLDKIRKGIMPCNIKMPLDRIVEDMMDLLKVKTHSPGVVNEWRNDLLLNCSRDVIQERWIRLLQKGWAGIGKKSLVN